MVFYKILGVIVLGLSLAGQSYGASVAASSSEASADWPPCKKALQTGQGLWFNMMWINRDKMPDAPYIHGPSKTEADLRDAFKNVVAWAKILPPQSVFNIWYDGALVGKNAPNHTQQVIDAMRREAGIVSSIQIILRDIQDVEFDSSYFSGALFFLNANVDTPLPPKVKLGDLNKYKVYALRNSDLPLSLIPLSESFHAQSSWSCFPLSWFFSDQMWVYFRVALLREMLAHWALTSNQTQCFVYSDIDLSPKDGYMWNADTADTNAIFNAKVQTTLSKTGMVQLEPKNKLELNKSSFFAMTSHTPGTLDIKKIWFIKEAMHFFGGKYQFINEILTKPLYSQEFVHKKLSSYISKVFCEYIKYMKDCSVDGEHLYLHALFHRWSLYDSLIIIKEGIHVPPRNKSYA